MKSKPVFALIALLAPVLAFSQSTAEIDRIYNKILKLNLIKYIQPILLKKGQYNDLLTALEKAHTKRDEINDLDAKEFRRLEADLDKSLESAYEGTYPKREVMEKIIKVQEALKIRRNIAVNEMIDGVEAACKKSLNDGQLAVMRNNIDPAYVGGKDKLDKMSDQEKLRLFIRAVFLDDMAYDIMKQMAKHASE